jgi:carotenoid cleavage dioxygenase
MAAEVLNHFPERPQFSGFMRPCRVEGDAQNLEIYGEIPKDIDGTFYRVMPDPQFPPFIYNDPVCIPMFPNLFDIDAEMNTIVVQWRRQY